jgi:hypothetical protein
VSILNSVGDPESFSGSEIESFCGSEIKSFASSSKPFSDHVSFCLFWCQPPVQDSVKCQAMGVKVTGTHV